MYYKTTMNDLEMKEIRSNAGLRDRIRAGKLDAADKRGRFVDPESPENIIEATKGILKGKRSLVQALLEDRKKEAGFG